MTVRARAVDDLLPLRPVVFQVLLALAERELHGYAIVRALGGLIDARIELEPGNLYRHLRFMLDANLIEESGRRPRAEDDDERRRYYRITRLGRQVASAETARLQRVVADARARLARTAGRD
jgi:DNA-binding PadR family transcriptional regulator